MPQQTLITFLGRQSRGSYPSTKYEMPDGRRFETSYIGLGLSAVLGVERVVILGTAGSMWDAILLAHDWPAEAPAGLDELSTMVSQQAVDQATLDALAPAFAQAMGGREVDIRVLPAAAGDLELATVVRQISETAGSGQLHIDVTHGLRHMAMAGLLAGQLFAMASRSSVHSVWYGAFDLKDPNTDASPVIRLEAVGLIQSWINALVAFDANGRYGVFCDLLRREGIAEIITDKLVKAQHSESMGNLAGAVSDIRSFLTALGTKSLPHTGTLFVTPLRSRLAWAQASDLSTQQLALASLALERDDFQRAALGGYEAVITRQCLTNDSDTRDRESREQTRKEMYDMANGGLASPSSYPSFELLNELRNALAHGTPVRSPKAKAACKSASSLRQALADALEVLRQHNCVVLTNGDPDSGFEHEDSDEAVEEGAQMTSVDGPEQPPTAVAAVDANQGR